MSTMDFLVNKMGWKVTIITRVPNCLTYSLERNYSQVVKVESSDIEGVGKKGCGLWYFSEAC